MLRTALLVVAILAGYDQLMNNGKFASATMQASTQILRHFGVL